MTASRIGTRAECERAIDLARRDGIWDGTAVRRVLSIGKPTWRPVGKGEWRVDFPVVLA